MKVIWLPLAKKQLRQTALYIFKEFGKKRKDEFLQEVKDANRLIGSNPYMGKPETLLDDYPELYRSYLVNNLNKIVYSEISDHIEVSAFWDVRRDPSVLADQLK